MKPFFEHGGIKVYCEDFLNIEAIEPNSIDLIVTSPPYNVDIDYEGYKDDIPYEKYLEFTEKWLIKAYKLLKHDGRMCLNIPLDKSWGRRSEGFIPVYVDIVHIARRVGFKYFSTIIWNEQNISRRTAWGSWMSAAAPYVIAPVEVIVVLYKERWRKKRKGISDITREEFIEWTNGVWNFPGENRKRVRHPSPFPIELPKRCIKLFSFVGDIVLDPFLGSGTTLIACLQTGRRGIGVEINRKYCELAVKRLAQHGVFVGKKDEFIKPSSQIGNL
ncbi:MAG: site-specific DNA-methyltransferase [Thermoprotei archaeon]|nr:site-specific DNA-methyltransferase [Thermoprotei archaeon]